jgi:hypothetical protein
MPNISRLFHNVFYRNIGVRRPGMMVDPPIIDYLILPKEVFLHHYQEGDGVLDIDTSASYLQGYGNVILFDVVTAYDETVETKLLKKTFQDMPAIVKFTKDHRNFKFLKDPHLTNNDPSKLVIRNYNFLKEHYTTIRARQTAFWKWQAVNKTIWRNISKASAECSRINVVIVDVGDEVVSLSILNSFSKRNDEQSVNGVITMFNTTEKLNIRDFYNWLNPETRKHTNIGELNDTAMSRTDIVFRSKTGKMVVLNLGYINSWIKGQNNLTEFPTISQYSFDVIQKSFVVFIMKLTSTAAVVEEIPEEEEINNSTIDEEATEGSDNEVTRSHKVKLKVTGISEISSVDVKARLAKKDDANESSSEGASLDDKLDTIDADLSTIEDIDKKKRDQKGIKVDDNGEVTIVDAHVTTKTYEQLHVEVFTLKTPKDAFIAKAEHAADTGLLSAAEYRKYIKQVEEFYEMPDPFNPKRKIKDIIETDPATLTLSKESSELRTTGFVPDESMKESTLNSFGKDYIRNQMTKDFISQIAMFLKAGVSIRNIEVEEDITVIGGYRNIRVTLDPIGGASSTLLFSIPIVEDDESFTVGGNKYKMKKQRVDLPIRKISPTEVQLSSYTGKTSVSLSETKSKNYYEWFMKQFNLRRMEDNSIITNVVPGDVFDSTIKAPPMYCFMSEYFDSFKIGKVKFVMDYDIRHDEFDPKLTEECLKIEKTAPGYITCGLVDKNTPVFMSNGDKDIPEGCIFVYRDKTLQPNGRLQDILKIVDTDAPVDYSSVKIFSKAIPVGVFLSYFYGFKEMLTLAKAKYRVVEGRKNKELQTYEFAVSFADVSYIFDRRQKTASMIVAGFHEYEKLIKKYPAEEFQSKDVYLLLLLSKGLSSVYIREMENVRDIFIDSVTLTVLKEMKEPLTYDGLLIRATELLETRYHPHPKDVNYQRFRYFERFSGAIYKDLADSYRQFRMKNLSGKTKIEMSPFQVRNSIMKDPTVHISQDINPIKNIKEGEAITFNGQGGRIARAMNRKSRESHVSSPGVISEATVDSSDVGVNEYFSTNPDIYNTLGMVSANRKEINPTNVFSIAALLAPSTARDDAKRTGFVSIQQEHTVPVVGYKQSHIRTGAESSVALLANSDAFASSAEQDGEVISLTPKGLIVKYKDGLIRGHKLGRVHGKAEGSMYPHDLVANVKLGEKFTKGRVLTYNTLFFEEDFIVKGSIVIKNAMPATVALLEVSGTYEDACSLTPALAKKSLMPSTKVKSITVDFKQQIKNIVKVNQEVMPGDILAFVENEFGADSSYSDDAVDTLSRISRQAPKSSIRGTIDKIEVLYHGDKQDMSASLKALADASDKELAYDRKSQNKPVVTGSVDTEYRVSGNSLLLDTAEIKIYISTLVTAAVADKGVFANQMKSTLADVISYTVTTEDGIPIDAMFGLQSLLGRICNSPFDIGTTIPLLNAVSVNSAKIYFGEKS